MRPPTNFGVREEVKNEFSWGKARKRSCMKVESKLVHPKVVRWAEEYNHKTPYFIKIIGNSSDYTRHFENHGAKLVSKPLSIQFKNLPTSSSTLSK